MRDRQDVSAAPASLHVDRTGHLVLPLPVREAFPFFTPEGERRWVPGWAPEYLHPAEPSAEPGTVFRTQVDGEETLWIVLQFDPARAHAAYARMTPGSRIGLVSIQCAEAEPGSTRVTVTYSLTALTSAGHAILSDLTAERFDAMLAEWRNAILRIDPDRR